MWCERVLYNYWVVFLKLSDGYKNIFIFILNILEYLKFLKKKKKRNLGKCFLGRSTSLSKRPDTQDSKNTNDSSICPHPPNSAVTSKALLPLFLPHPLLPGLTRGRTFRPDQLPPLSDRRARFLATGVHPSSGGFAHEGVPRRKDCGLLGEGWAGLRPRRFPPAGGAAGQART